MITNAPAQEQRRRFARIFFDARASLRTDGLFCTAQLVDLSLRGALLEVPSTFTPDPGSTCHFELHLGEESATITMEATVAHRETRDAHHRVGLHCHGMDLDSVTHLRRLVELNLGNDALLQRELAALAEDEAGGPKA